MRLDVHLTGHGVRAAAYRGTRSALRIPRQLISELASAPMSESVEMQQSETCGLEILPSETTSASAPVRKQENTASVSAPGLPRTRFIIPVVTTSSASSDTVSCHCEQRRGRALIILQHAGDGQSHGYPYHHDQHYKTHSQAQPQ